MHIWRCGTWPIKANLDMASNQLFWDEGTGPGAQASGLRGRASRCTEEPLDFSALGCVRWQSTEEIFGR